ncbi:hypothetical protein GGX14DRAFT_402290 [Mycena pura]|uniref:Uncharacterized protein n=1 Tax=Mycena pura TaxID=153505 RepID=A0AAD6V120_9AGAR|nr:hypothetical protein GGX14DRAFT_402290 [Mycena pura]
MNSKHDSGLVANFTADNGIKCAGCNECIDPESGWKYFKRRGGGGYRVCVDCVPRYSTKVDTMSRDKASGPDTHAPAANLTPALSSAYVQDVREHVIGARRKGMGSVSFSFGYMGPPSHLMGPPPTPAGIQVNVPSTWSRSAYSYAPQASQAPVAPVAPPGYGYSAAHNDWAAQKKIWSAKAYQSTAPPAVILRFQLMHGLRGKTKGQLIGVS